MDDLLQRLPGARRALFSAFHVGGCQSCAYRDEETLAEVCTNHGLEIEEAIRTLLESHQHDQTMLLDPVSLFAKHNAGEAILLVDTRTREEHEAVTIAGSQLMTQELQQSLFATPPEQSIVLYDHSGRNVLDHCAWFRGHGLKNTFALTGGIDAWSRDVDPSLPRYRLEME
jgi:rhodanese-related sulfurtransferase